MKDQYGFRARVYFLRTDEGGRKSDLPSELRVPMQIGGEFLDCIVIFDRAPLVPLGREYEVDVQFLSPDLAREAVSRDPSFVLWEGKPIGRGQILIAPGGEAEGTSAK